MPLLIQRVEQQEESTSSSSSASLTWTPIRITNEKNLASVHPLISSSSSANSKSHKKNTSSIAIPRWLRTLLWRTPYLQHASRVLIEEARQAEAKNRQESGDNVTASSATSIAPAPSSALIYVHQREIAIVTPIPPAQSSAAASSPSASSPIEYIGSADATTCVILLLVCTSTQRTICCHLDGAGEEQLRSFHLSSDVRVSSVHNALAQLSADDISQGVDLHLVGGFQTHATKAQHDEHERSTKEEKDENQNDGSESNESEDNLDNDPPEEDQSDGLLQVRNLLTFLHRYSSGHSRIEASRRFDMRLCTLCVGGMNTQWSADEMISSAASSSTFAASTSTSSNIAPAASASSSSLTASSTTPSSLPPKSSALSYPRPYLTSAYYHFSSRRIIGVLPTSRFHPRHDRGPLLLHRFVRSFLGPSHLEQVYRESTDSYDVHACAFDRMDTRYLRSMLSLPDTDFLRSCSTSPLVEPSNFIPDMRELFTFLVKYPEWNQVWKRGEGEVRRFSRSTGKEAETEAQIYTQTKQAK